MQYNREFRKLAHFVPSLVAAEKDKMKRFLNGLRPIMQKDLSTSKFLTHAELLDTVLKLERGYNQLHAYHNQGEKKRVRIEKQKHNYKMDGRNNKRRWDRNSRPQTRFNRKCATCGRDHETKNCPQTIGACFKCGQKGHLIANCPKGVLVPYNNQGQNSRQLPAPPQRTQGRVFALTNEEASNSHDVVKGSGKTPM